MPTFLFALCMCILEGGALDKVLGVVPQLFTLATTCFNAVLDNPVLLLYFSVGLIGIGFAIFRKMKRAAVR